MDGEQRWDEAWSAAAERVEAARDADGLWTQHLDGHDVPLPRPRARLRRATSARSRTAAECRRRRRARALRAPRGRSRELAAAATASRPDEIRVQWCHGAPGIVATLGDLMTLELALAGGELTWRAGPLAKGPGLCHGTAGNAYAFLVLHARTGDELWLERARALRDARDRPGRAGAGGARPRPLLALHRRHRRRAFPPPPARRRPTASRRWARSPPSARAGPERCFDHRDARTTRLIGLVALLVAVLP